VLTSSGAEAALVEMSESALGAAGVGAGVGAGFGARFIGCRAGGAATGSGSSSIYA
jgi:hypothetical protein